MRLGSNEIDRNLILAQALLIERAVRGLATMPAPAWHLGGGTPTTVIKMGHGLKQLLLCRWHVCSIGFSATSRNG